MEERKKKIQEELVNGTLLLPRLPKEEEVKKPTVVKPQPQKDDTSMVPAAE